MAKWECEFCEKAFKTKEEAEKHEESCGRGKKKVNENSKGPLISFKGGNGRLELYKDFVRIDSDTIAGVFMKGLKGKKDIYFDKIGSIQIKKPGITRGYIQFSLMGGNESRGGVFSAVNDENTIIFSNWKPKEQYEEALEIKEYIEKKFLKKDTHSPNGLADEIEKLHKLMKKGIISKEEFEDKKKNLLDL